MFVTMRMVLLLVVYAALFLGIPLLIGVYVYRDAKAREMPAALWAVVAALCPAFIGLVIYLLARTGRSALRCPGCGGPVQESFALCPRCGAPLKDRCQKCGFALERDWTVCPSCGQPIPEEGRQAVPPVRRGDRGLTWMLAVVIAIPVLLLAVVLLSLVSFQGVAGGGTSMMGVDAISASDLREGSAVAQWVAQCDETGDDGIYALASVYQDGEETVSAYWLYLKNVNGLVNHYSQQEGSLFSDSALVVDLTPDVSAPPAYLVYVETRGGQSWDSILVTMDGETLDCTVTESGERLTYEGQAYPYLAS